MSGNRHRAIPAGAAPLQRSVTVSNYAPGAAVCSRRHQHMVAAARAQASGAGRVSDANVSKIERGIGIMRAQTGLGLNEFAAAVSAVLDTVAGDGVGDADDAHVPHAPASLSLEERVARAQSASAEYVARWGLPCNLIFGAAGMPAIAYAGALAQAERLGLLASVRNWAGCSGGAIIAGLLAAGLPVARIAALARTADLARIMRVGRLAGRRFMRNHGMIDGKRFVVTFRAALRAAVVDDKITLKALHDLRGGRAVFAVTCLTTSRVMYIDYRTHPDLPLWKAVRMAMSVPTVFAPVEHGGDYYTDASVLAGLPVDAFHWDDIAPINQRTLSFWATCDGVSDKPRDSIGAKLSATADTMMAVGQRFAMDEQDRQRCIMIDCGRMSSMDFALSPAAREALIDAGASAVVDHFAGGARAMVDRYCVERNGMCADDQQEEPAAVVSSVLQKGKTRVNLLA